MSWIVLQDKTMVGVKAEGESSLTGERIRARLSSANPDSDEDIIHQTRNKKGRGWVFDRFNKVPIITWAHGIREPNLSGTATRALILPDDPLGKVLGLDPVTFDTDDPPAARIEGKVRRGVLKEWSVGFRALKHEPRRNTSGDLVRGFEIFEAELIEAAVCNRGANLDTTTMVKSLLGRTEIAAEAETGGDSEALELKAELEALDHQVKQLQKMLADLNDELAPLRALDPVKLEKAAGVAERLESRQRQYAEAVGGLYLRLVAGGTAHP